MAKGQDTSYNEERRDFASIVTPKLPMRPQSQDASGTPQAPRIPLQAMRLRGGGNPSADSV